MNADRSVEQSVALPAVTTSMQPACSLAMSIPQQVMSAEQPPPPLLEPVLDPVLLLEVAEHCELQLDISQVPIASAALVQPELMFISQVVRQLESLHWQPEMQLKYEPHAPSAEETCDPQLLSTHDEQAWLFAPDVAVEPWQVGKPPPLDLLLQPNATKAANEAAASPITSPFIVVSLFLSRGLSPIRLDVGPRASFSRCETVRK
jgi:hypothetical protein